MSSFFSALGNALSSIINFFQNIAIGSAEILKTVLSNNAK